MGKKGKREATAGSRPKTKTRKRILTWYFTDVPGHRVVHRMYIETEVIENGTKVRPVPGARMRAQNADKALSQVQAPDSRDLPLPFEPSWLDTEPPCPAAEEIE